MKKLIIVPAYNESENIFNVVRNIKVSNSEFDIVVINDGSKDNTAQEAKRAGARVVTLSSNLGIGGAVQTGYLYAYKNGYDIAVQIDGDGQHCSADLHKLLEKMEADEADMIIGSRFIEQSEYKSKLFRSIGIKYFSKLVSYLCKIPYYDTTSGYRMVNKKAIELFVKYYPQDYPEVETIVYAVRSGLRVKEIKVNMKDRQGGKSSITPIKSIYYMIKVTMAILVDPKVTEV